MRKSRFTEARLGDRRDGSIRGSRWRSTCTGGRGPAARASTLDCVYLHTGRRKPGVTLELLHLEHLERHPDGYRDTQFCEICRQWLARHRLTIAHTARQHRRNKMARDGIEPPTP